MMRASVCVCMCAHALACVRVCVCVCVADGSWDGQLGSLLLLLLG